MLRIDDKPPDRPAIIDEGRSVTYGELSARVEALAARMARLGIGERSRIGILLPNGEAFAAALLAASRLGSGAVLLSTYFTSSELSTYLEEAQINLVVSDDRGADLLGRTSRRVAAVQDLEPSSGGGVRAFTVGPSKGGRSSGRANGSPEEFILQFTSGSSGRAKIVMRTYAAVQDEIHAYVAATRLSEADRIVCLTPFFHAYGLVNGLLPALEQGATLLWPGRFVPGEFVRTIPAQQPTLLIGVPFMYGLLAQVRLEGSERFDTFRYCFSAGAKLDPAVSRSFADRFGVPVCQLYGSTETGVIAFNAPEEAVAYPESVGRPLLGRTVDAIDDAGAPLPPGGVGRLRIRSRGNSRGYVNRPELNPEAFAGPSFTSSDLGFLDPAGRIQVTGRRAPFINVAGMKVDPVEVEQVLTGYPGVREVAVVGKDGPLSSEIVVAFVEAEEAVDRSALVRFCRERLAEYKVPRIVNVVKTLPRSPMGKVLKKHLCSGEWTE